MSSIQNLKLDDTNGIAEFHESRARCVREAVHGKALAGDFPGCAPVGYINAQDGAKAVIAIDSMHGLLIQEVFRLAATGKHSLRRLLVIMTGKGLRSRNGLPKGVSALWNVLTNPFYAGYIRYGGQTVRGNHLPLISEALFSRVQDRLAERRRSKGSQCVAIRLTDPVERPRVRP